MLLKIVPNDNDFYFYSETLFQNISQNIFSWLCIILYYIVLTYILQYVKKLRLHVFSEFSKAKILWEVSWLYMLISSVYFKFLKCRHNVSFIGFLSFVTRNILKFHLSSVVEIEDAVSRIAAFQIILRAY